MQSNVGNRVLWPLAGTLMRPTITSHIYQVRYHVKMYPWRRQRKVRECYLDATQTPYTDKHNMNEFKSMKPLKPWMKFTPKEKEAKYNGYHFNEAYTSDPAEAKETASSRLTRFHQSLKDRGQTREKKSYSPPDNVREKVIAIYNSLISIEKLDSSIDTMDVESVLNCDLNRSKALKFNLITSCISTFGHDVSSSLLNDINTINDVVEYFSTEVQGASAFDSLMNIRELPPNLSILPTAQRYNRENDTKFGGITALPGVISRVPGLRAAKKFEILNQDEFQWPDI